MMIDRKNSQVLRSCYHAAWNADAV